MERDIAIEFSKDTKMSTAIQSPSSNIVELTPKKPTSSWRGFSTTQVNHIGDAQFPDRIEGPSAWNGKELEQQPEKWIYHVTEQDIADIDAALRHFEALDLPLV